MDDLPEMIQVLLTLMPSSTLTVHAEDELENENAGKDAAEDSRKDQCPYTNLQYNFGKASGCSVSLWNTFLNQKDDGTVSK